MKELNRDIYEWSSPLKTNSILADIFDVLMNINANLVAIGSHRAPKPVKPYPRPGTEDPNTKHYGNGALPANELEEWFERKRKEYGKRTRGC